MIRQLAHGCFYTDNLPAMLNFYRDKLGFAVKFSLTDRNGTTFGHYFACGNSTFVEVFDRQLANAEWSSDSEPTRDNGAARTSPSFRHICFEVTGLRELRGELQARGVEVSDIDLGRDHALQAWIKDPDGNDIELMEYTHNSLQL
jgi:catechol 2,3-dioxygenase-like lactoylglutathione lyase family enzyme